MKLSSAFIEKNTTVETAIDACSLLAKWKLFNLRQHPSRSINPLTLKKVIKPFNKFQLLISFFSYQLLIALFARVLLIVTVCFRTSCSKQAQYLKFKWTELQGNIVVQTKRKQVLFAMLQTFTLLQWKCASAKRFW